jgi:hypothetical protein
MSLQERKKALDDPQQAANLYFYSHLLAHLAHEGFGGAFTQLNAPAGKGPGNVMRGAMYYDTPLIFVKDHGDGAQIEAPVAPFKGNHYSLVHADLHTPFYMQQ